MQKFSPWRCIYYIWWSYNTYDHILQILVENLAKKILSTPLLCDKAHQESTALCINYTKLGNSFIYTSYKQRWKKTFPQFLFSWVPITSRAVKRTGSTVFLICLSRDIPVPDNSLETFSRRFHLKTPRSQNWNSDTG